MNENVDTSDSSVPLFKSWNLWYALIVVFNVLLIVAIYLYFKSL